MSPSTVGLLQVADGGLLGAQEASFDAQGVLMCPACIQYASNIQHSLRWLRQHCVPRAWCILSVAHCTPVYGHLAGAVASWKPGELSIVLSTQLLR